MFNKVWKTITTIANQYYINNKEEANMITKEEKMEIALKQAREIILDRVTAAEIDYADWKKAGTIKRAQVLDEIFATYPILGKITNQEDVIKKLDEYIDEALETLREVIETNTPKPDGSEE